MFCTFSNTESQFLKGKKSNLILIVGLSYHTAVFFYNDSTFYYISIKDMKCLYQDKLQGNAYKGVAISPFQIIVSIVETKNFIKLNLKQKSQKQVFKMVAPLNYNMAREKQKFFLSTIEAFKQTSSFYIKQTLHQQRKFKLFYFKNKQKSDIQLFQFSNKDKLVQRLDDVSSVAVYNQTPQQNAVFKFSEYDLNNRQIKIQYRLQNSVFVSYCSILAIRKLKSGKFLIGLNSNQKHHLIIFDKMEVNSSFYKSDQLLISNLFINNQKNYGIFIFLSKQHPKKNSIRLLNLQTGKLICQTCQTMRQYSVSFDEDHVINYIRQIRPTTSTYISTLHLIQKKNHYMKILQALQTDLRYGCEFNEKVMSFLK